MRWHRQNGFPDNPDFEPETEGGWQPLPEPPPEKLQAYAGMTAAIATPVLLLVWAMLLPAEGKFQAITSAATSVIVLLLPLVVLHEVVHLWLHPGQGRSAQSVVGGSSKHGAIYAMYFGEMSRARFVVILLGPFVVFTVLPLLWCLAQQRFVPWLAGVSVLNGLLACGDLMGAWMVLRGSPRGARLRNRGYHTWWKPALSASA